MRTQIGSPLSKTSNRLAVLGTAALALTISLAPNASAQDVRSTDVEVWMLPDLDPFTESASDWIAGSTSGAWVDGISLVNTGATGPSLSPPFSDQLGLFIDLGRDLANGATGTISSQLVSGGSVQFDAAGLVAPTTLAGAVHVSRNSPAGSGDFTVTGFSFAGPDAGLFDLPTFTPTAITAGQQTANFDLGFAGTCGGGGPLAATLTFTTDTGLDLPLSILAPMSVAADVRVLPDYDPWVEDIFTWFDGNATGQWSDGLALVGTGAETPNLRPEAQSDLTAYLNTGTNLTLPEFDTGSGTISNQLVAPGQTQLKVFDNASPQTVFDAVLIERSSPDGSADLVLDTYAVTGPDAAFFDLDLFTAIASDPLTPGSDLEDAIAFDLIFNPDGLDLAGQTDFAAVITFTADTGLEIPVNVSATTVPEPTSAALLLASAALLIRRRRA